MTSIASISVAADDTRIGWLAVLLLDAVTRASFSGFPTGFLGMLLIGLGIAASTTPSVAANPPRW